MIIRSKACHAIAARRRLVQGPRSRANACSSGLGTRDSGLQEGFTLLEVMVALAIMAIALVALLGLGNRSIATNERLQKITQATLLAQERMTEIEVEATQGAVQVLDEEGVFEEPFSEYRWRVTYEETPLPDLQMVTVTVAWGEEERNEMVDLNSFVFR